MNKLFPVDLFPRVLSKSSMTLELTSNSDSTQLSTSGSQGKSKPEVVPFPEPFERAMDCEREQPIHPKHSSRMINKLYTLPERVMKQLKVPSVDALVASISSSAILPMEGKGGPKDSCDR